MPTLVFQQTKSGSFRTNYKEEEIYTTKFKNIQPGKLYECGLARLDDGRMIITECKFINDVILLLEQFNCEYDDKILIDYRNKLYDLSIKYEKK